MTQLVFVFTGARRFEIPACESFCGDGVRWWHGDCSIDLDWPWWTPGELVARGFVKGRR